MARDLAQAAQDALMIHQLAAEGQLWAGGPLSADDMKLLAGASADALNIPILLNGIRDSADPVRVLRDLLAITWASGYRTGTLHDNDSTPEA